jgi:hypothetical protein
LAAGVQVSGRGKRGNDSAAVLASLDDWRDEIVSVAVPRALNTLANQADVAIRRKIRDIYGISTADLAPYFNVKLASIDDPQAAIEAQGKGFPLKFFKPVRTAHGTAVTIKGRVVEFAHAFRASAGLDTTQVFARGRYGVGAPEAPRQRRGRRKAGLQAPSGGSVFRASGEAVGRFQYGLGRHPITLLRSSSAPDALSNQEVIDAGNARVEEQAAKVLAREIAAARRGY